MEDMRPTNDVFKSGAAGNNEAFRSRFASSGKFEKAQLESGAELQEDSEQQDEEAGAAEAAWESPLRAVEVGCVG